MDAIESIRPGKSRQDVGNVFDNGLVPHTQLTENFVGTIQREGLELIVTQGADRMRFVENMTCSYL